MRPLFVGNNEVGLFTSFETVDVDLPALQLGVLYVEYRNVFGESVPFSFTRKNNNIHAYVLQIDQLFKIQSVCGTPTWSTWAEGMALAKAAKFTFVPVCADILN